MLCLDRLDEEGREYDLSLYGANDLTMHRRLDIVF